MKTLVRSAIASFVRQFEYRLTDMKSDPMGLAGACGQLIAHGFAPRTVVDVGVGPGTPWLYAAFPKARFELFEPIETFRPQIEESTRGLDVAVHYCALGERRSTARIEVNAAQPTSSSMASYADQYLGAGRNDAPLPQTIPKDVAVRALDEFGPFAGPTLLKLDVEGYEDRVLAGARRSLENVDVIISEVSVVRRTERELSFGAYLGLVESLGFSMVNIADISPISRGGPIAYMDVVFVRSDSPLRYGRR